MKNNTSKQENVLSGKYKNRTTGTIYTRVTEQNGIYTVTNEAGSQYFVNKDKLELILDINPVMPSNDVHSEEQDKVTRFEVIDHRQCVYCRGRMLENRLVNGEYKEMPCSKCNGSGTRGGRVYGAFSNPETSMIQIQLSYQDEGRTLKVFVSDRIQPLNEREA